MRQKSASVEVAFSPDGGAENLVLGAINGAQRSIRLMAYSFTAEAVVRALISARRRGVDVAVTVDYRNNIEEDRSGRARAALGDGTTGLQAAPPNARRALENLMLQSANLLFATANSADIQALIEDRSQFDWTIVEEAGKAIRAALGFLADERRMNVLLSRARYRMVIIGSLDFLHGITRNAQDGKRWPREFRQFVEWKSWGVSRP